MKAIDQAKVTYLENEYDDKGNIIAQQRNSDDWIYTEYEYDGDLIISEKGTYQGETTYINTYEYEYLYVE